MLHLNKTPLKRMMKIFFNSLLFFLFTSSTVYSAVTDTQISLQTDQSLPIVTNGLQSPLTQTAQNEAGNYRPYKSNQPVKAAKDEENLFSNPGNIALIGLAAVAIGSAAYISANYEVEKIPDFTITSPVENEEVFTITAIQGTSVNFTEGDYIKISIQKHGENEWIEQSGYGGINPGGGDWIVRFCQFGTFGPADVGSSFRFKAIMRNYKDKILAEQHVENVIRK